jgi:hypothetical protein
MKFQVWVGELRMALGDLFKPLRGTVAKCIWITIESSASSGREITQMKQNTLSLEELVDFVDIISRQIAKEPNHLYPTAF